MDPPSNTLSAAFSSRNLTPSSKRKTKRLVTSKSNSCPTGRAAGAESSRSQESGSHGDRNHRKPPPWRWLENVKKSGKENPPEVKVFKSYLFNNKPGHFATFTGRPKAYGIPLSAWWHSHPNTHNRTAPTTSMPKHWHVVRLQEWDCICQLNCCHNWTTETTDLFLISELNY